MRIFAGCAAARAALSTSVSVTSVVARPLGAARIAPCAASEVAPAAERASERSAVWYRMGGGGAEGGRSRRAPLGGMLERGTLHRSGGPAPAGSPRHPRRRHAPPPPGQYLP